MERFIGKVIWFTDNLGYGFIERKDEPDLFVYWADIDPESVKGRRQLKKGQQVSYSLGTNHDGKPKAVNVVPVQASIIERQVIKDE